MYVKKSYAFLLSILLIFGVVLAGCSSNEKSSGDEKVTLNIALWDENVSEVVDKSVALFEKEHPNVKVNITYTPFADYWAKLKTSAAGGSGPDIFWMNGPNFHQYASNGLIKDLQPLIEKDKIETSVYTPALVDLYTYEDHLYGMPYFLDSVALYYNKKLFDDAGLPYPDETWTWETIEEVGEKLTDKDKKIYGYIASNLSQQGYYNLIHQAGGYVINEDKTKSGYNLPETKEAFEFTKRLMDKGISPSAKTQVETKGDQIFGSGKAAMAPAISVIAPTYYEMLGENLGIAPLPKGKQKATIVHGLSWSMNDKTKHEDLAWELLKKLSGKEAGQYMGESGFSIPAYQEAESLWVESIPSINLKVFTDSLEFGVPYPISKDTEKWQNVEVKEFKEAFLGKKSIDEAAETVQKEMDEILKNEK
ncbi:ABC transporter substrate-binding protein [Metabacillus idriensis]|uniref:ABC transporter substrate-binding protein n=1 Tax=Metabacillus idriensis TaxID=324768 RepID=UPI0012B0AFE6